MALEFSTFTFKLGCPWSKSLVTLLSGASGCLSSGSRLLSPRSTIGIFDDDSSGMMLRWYQLAYLIYNVESTSRE
jgi:hypothetical protein